MSETERRCGTCRHSRPTNWPEYFKCAMPTPECLDHDARTLRRLMTAGEGTVCKTWEPAMTDTKRRLLEAGDALAEKAEATLIDPHGFLWKRAEFWAAYDAWLSLSRELKQESSDD